MKWKLLLKIFSMALVIALFTDCKGPGWGGGIDFGDELPGDSEDRPAWAGGNTDANDHNKKPTPGTMGGKKDYGDLVVLDREPDGVPKMDKIPVRDEDGIIVDEDGDGEPDEYFFVYVPMYVIGTDDYGNLYEPIPLDQFGEVPSGYSVVEVDFGRLNIVRSPVSVLNQALVEVTNAMDAGTRFTQDFCGRLSIWDGDVLVKTIDSPRESMAIYKEIMNNGFGGAFSNYNLSGIAELNLAAASFAAGSDKTGTVDVDEVEYINGMMKCYGSSPLTDDVDKEYFNFGGFSYDRGTTYENRWLKVIELNGDGTYNEEIVTVKDAMENRELFRYRYSGGASNVNGFACAIDDAVQVLEFVHGNSNIEFLPDYEP